MKDTPKLIWDTKLIDAFWNGITDTPMDRISFGKTAGQALLQLVRKYLPEQSSVLDFGSGSGDLIKILMEQGFRCAAYDASQDRSKSLSQAACGNQNFLGHINASDNRVFDVVFCTEVIEHINPSELKPFVRKIASLVAPGGLLVLTTPNEENLDDNLCFCPQCKHTFHRWQHLNSFSASGINNLFNVENIDEVATYITDFSGNAIALSVWRTLNSVVAKPTSTTGFAAGLRHRLKKMRFYFTNRLKVANTAIRFVLGEEYPMSEPGIIYGNGNGLVFIGRKTQ